MFGSNPFGSQSVGSNISPFGGGQTNTAPSAFGSQPSASSGPFGSAAPTSTGFGSFGSSTMGGTTAGAGGGFGGFGSSASTTQPTFGGFGSTSGQPTAGPFGTNVASPFGAPQGSATNTGGGLFGSSSTVATTSSAPGTMFGGTGGFGSNNMSTSAPATGFGGFGSAVSTAAPAFGSTSTAPSMFGSTTARPGGLFGSTNPPAASSGFGSMTSSSTAPAFGSATQTTTSMPFGATPSTAGGGLFGSTSSTMQAPQQTGTSSVPFQTTNKADGNTTITMQTITAMPVYENKSLEELRYEDYLNGNRGTQGQQPQVSSFGGFGTSTTSTTGAFGAPSSTGFGSISTPATGGLFGSTSAPSATNPFAPSNASSVFGGSKPLGTGFGSTTTPTTPTAFGSTSTTGGFGGFGAAAKPATSGLFGSAPSASTGSLFGSAPTSTAPTTTNLFGSAPSQPASGLFGSSAPAPSFGSGGGFGSAPAPVGSLFGAPTTAPAQQSQTTGGFFGSAATATAPNSAPTGGLFGAPAAPTGGLFGSSTPTTPSSGFFGASATNTAPSMGGLFGTPSSSTGGMFGAAPKPSTGSFFGGNTFTSPNPSAAGAGGYGSNVPVSTPANTAFPSSSGGGLFGPSFPQSSASPGGFFGSTNMTPLNATTISVPPTADALLAQQLAAVEAQKKELALLEAWRGASPTGSRIVAYSQPDRSVASRPSLLSDYRSSSAVVPFASPPLHQSTVKVRPRGFASVESPSPRPALENGIIGNGTPQMLSPNAYLGLSSKTLIIKSKLTPKPKMKLNISKDETPDNNMNQSFDRGSDSIYNQSRMSIGSVEGGDYGEKSHGSEHASKVVEKLNGHLEKTSFLSPSMGKFELSAPSTSSVKRSDQRPDASYDFYQKVIGSPLADGSSLLSPSTATEVAKSAVPKLTKQGYAVSPSLDILSKMSEADLAAVSSFTVSREGYGSVAWEGAVDVRGVDLDSVVDIDSQTVAVYSMEEAKGSKPPVGSKLNRPAIITILNIHPKDPMDSSTDSKQRFERKVARLTKKADAELISYDIETGIWRFRVFHFSRYAFDDDESEDEGDISQDREGLRIFNAQNSSDNREYEGKAYTRFTIQSVLDDDLSDNERDSPMLYSEEVSLKDVNENSLIQAAEDAYKLFSMEENYQPEMFARIEDDGRQLFTPAQFEDEGCSQMDFFLPVRNFNENIQFCHQTSICAKIAKRSGLTQESSSKTDFGLRMGKSFRVGWRPDGSLVCQKANGISTLRPSLSARDEDGASNTITIKMLSTHLKHSTRQSSPDSLPTFSLPESSEQRFSVALRDLRDNASCEQEGTQRIVTLGLSLLLIVAQWNEVDTKRKLRALALWFRQASSQGVMDSRPTTRHDGALQSIYAALCNNDICKAQSLAHENEYLQLSALIANSSVMASSVVKQQRELWYTTGALRFVPPLLSSLYALRSGDAALEKDVMPYDMNSSSDPCMWRRCMGMLLFRNENGDSERSPIHLLVSTYKRALEKGNVPLPLAWYENPRSGNTQELCLLYKLFLLLAKEKSSLVDIINPNGHTHYHHDYLNSFFLASTISAIRDLPCVTAEEGLMICENLAGQLISVGLWEWAVYVYLYRFGHETFSLSTRKEKAKDIVHRFFDGSSPSKHFFLHLDLGVPVSWLEESLAYRCHYRFDYMGFIHHSSYFSKRLLYLSSDKLFSQKN